MHCASCVLLIENEVGALPGVTRVTANLASRTADVTGDFGDKDAAALAKEFSAPVAEHGYSLTVESAASGRTPGNLGEFRVALPLAAAVIAAFLLLQKAGLVNLIGGGNVTYGTAFAIGIVASLSTCLAVVGGLVLSVSASYAKHGDAVRPHVLFHASRLFAFFLLGGAIGAAGAAIPLGPAGMTALSLTSGLVMLALGLQLLDLFDWSARLLPVMPKALSRRAMSATRHRHVLAPVIAGTATFFLPCGFTQSMQFVTLSSGGFLRGGLLMLAFALGTLPVLALISAGASKARNMPSRGLVFKTAGLLVIAFAAFNLYNVAAAEGLVPPLAL